MPVALHHRTCALPLGIALASLIGAPTWTFAADAPAQPNAQAPVAPRLLPQNPGAGFELPPVPSKGVAPVAPGAPTLLVNRIAFRGNVVIASSELDAVAAPYLGRALNDADLEELRLKLTRHYIDRGYITSGALLKPGAISGNSVTFDLVEGKVSAVRIRGLERLNEHYVVDRLTPDTAAAVNMEALRERFQRLLEDPLFERMNARLLPDARLGESVLDIEVARARPYQFSVFTNNYRPPSVGGGAYGANLLVRNLTGYGDQLELSSSTAHQSGGNRMAATWKMPLNARGTVFSVQTDNGRSSVVEESTKSLDIRSQLDSTDIGLSQVVLENIRHRITLGINESERRNTTTLLGQPFSFSPGEVNGVTKVSAWRLWQDYSYRDETQAASVRSTFTFARSNLQAMNGVPGGGPSVDPNYSLWLGQLQYVRQVTESGAQVTARATVQASRNTLASLDRMAIGGVYTVRGYLENTFTRDTGEIVNLEFNYPLVRNGGRGFNLNLVPFYDSGRGQNRNQGADSLTSAGLAMRMSWQGATVDIAIASRLHHPSSLTLKSGSLQEKGIHLQVSYSAF
jgi:hemolysin activation/secretion protein